MDTAVVNTKRTNGRRAVNGPAAAITTHTLAASQATIGLPPGVGSLYHPSSIEAEAAAALNPQANDPETHWVTQVAVHAAAQPGNPHEVVGPLTTTSVDAWKLHALHRWQAQSVFEEPWSPYAAAARRMLKSTPHRTTYMADGIEYQVDEVKDFKDAIGESGNPLEEMEASSGHVLGGIKL